MSISLSGGDIAFIAAFIVLPTLILASCIWAIIAIRAGALLPQRAPLAAHEDDTEALPPEWPFVAGEQMPFDATASNELSPVGASTGTAEHTAILPDAAARNEAGAEVDQAAAPTELDADSSRAPVAASPTPDAHEQSQETGEYPLVPEGDWSRPAEAGAGPVAPPPEPDDVETQPATTAVPPEVDTWDTEPEPEPDAEPEPEPEPDTAIVAADTDDEEPVPDAAFEHTTDLPPPVAIKRKPARKVVAQLRPPVATTGRSRLRPAGGRRGGEPAADNALATEDEGAVQGDDSPVDVRRADDE
jgi:hypothetical protein